MYGEWISFLRSLVSKLDNKIVLSHILEWSLFCGTVVINQTATTLVFTSLRWFLMRIVPRTMK